MIHNFTVENKNVLTWNADINGFLNMRSYLFTEQNMDRAFMGRFCDAMDELKEMPVGSTKFVLTSKIECYTADSLERLNKISETLEKGVQCGDLANDYEPIYMYVFCIKRTEKRYNYKQMDWHFVH